MASHLRTELIVATLDMARRPAPTEERHSSLGPGRQYAKVAKTLSHIVLLIPERSKRGDAVCMAATLASKGANVEVSTGFTSFGELEGGATSRVPGIWAFSGTVPPGSRRHSDLEFKRIGTSLPGPSLIREPLVFVAISRRDDLIRVV